MKIGVLDSIATSLKEYRDLKVFGKFSIKHKQNQDKILVEGLGELWYDKS